MKIILPHPFIAKFHGVMMMAIFALAFYFVFRILASIVWYSSKEGYTNVPSSAVDSIPEPAINELSALQTAYKSVPIKIKSMNAVSSSLPMNQVCVKSSFNSARTGQYVHPDMIGFVLSRGVRLIDLEIYLKDGKAVVAFSNNGADPGPIDPSANPVVNFDSINSIPLGMAFTSITTNAFNSASVPNPNDPLFVNLRIRSADPSIYSIVGGLVYTSMSGLLAKSNASYQNTPPAGKIVLMIDNTLDPKWRTKASGAKSSSASNLANYISLETGNNTGSISIYRDDVFSTLNKWLPQITSTANYTVGVKSAMIVYPTVNSANPDILDCVKGWGAQMVCQQYHLSGDKNLQYAESNIFTSSAIAPLATILQMT
jgi:hypothetical protein